MPQSTPPPSPPRRVFQVLLGALVGLAVAVTIGGAFIAIWFTQAKDLWTNSEQLWEGTLSLPPPFLPISPDMSLGIFELIASVMIFVMGVTMLKMENARTKWRIKLQNAFNTQRMPVFDAQHAPLTPCLRA